MEIKMTGHMTKFVAFMVAVFTVTGNAGLAAQRSVVARNKDVPVRSTRRSKAGGPTLSRSAFLPGTARNSAPGDLSEYVKVMIPADRRNTGNIPAYIELSGGESAADGYIWLRKVGGSLPNLGTFFSNNGIAGAYDEYDSATGEYTDLVINSSGNVVQAPGQTVYAEKSGHTITYFCCDGSEKSVACSGSTCSVAQYGAICNGVTGYSFNNWKNGSTTVSVGASIAAADTSLVANCTYTEPTSTGQTYKITYHCPHGGTIKTQKDIAQDSWHTMLTGDVMTCQPKLGEGKYIKSWGCYEKGVYGLQSFYGGQEMQFRYGADLDCTRPELGTHQGSCPFKSYWSDVTCTNANVDNGLLGGCISDHCFCESYTYPDGKGNCVDACRGGMSNKVSYPSTWCTDADDYTCVSKYCRCRAGYHVVNGECVLGDPDYGCNGEHEIADASRQCTGVDYSYGGCTRKGCRCEPGYFSHKDTTTGTVSCYDPCLDSGAELPSDLLDKVQVTKGCDWSVDNYGSGNMNNCVKTHCACKSGYRAEKISGKGYLNCLQCTGAQIQSDIQNEQLGGCSTDGTKCYYADTVPASNGDCVSPCAGTDGAEFAKNNVCKNGTESGCVKKHCKCATGYTLQIDGSTRQCVANE